MTVPFKALTDFFREVGADQVEHTEKTYLAHAIGVYNDLKAWGCEEELARVGVFHSVYGTASFQGFTLALDRRGQVRSLVGERTERLSYFNCAMQREHFDAQIENPQGPYTLFDRFTETEISISDEEFHDLCVVHLCDWLEQVERWGNWGHRREAYRVLALRLGEVALESYDRVFANEPAANSH